MKNLIKNKGGIFPPFVLFLFINVLFSASIFRNITHPNYEPFIKYDNTDLINIYNQSDITFINKNDSTTIKKEIRGLSIGMKKNNFLIDINSSQNTEFIKEMTDVYSFIYKNNSKSISTKITYQKYNIIKPQLYIEKNDKNKMTYALGFSYQLNSKLNFDYHYKMGYDKYFMKLSYDDFDFSHNINNEVENHFISFKHDNEKISSNLYFMDKNFDTKRLDPNILNQDYKTNNHQLINYGLGFSSELMDSKFLSCNYYNKEMNLSFDMIEDDIEIIKINLLNYKSKFYSLGYNNRKNNREIGIFKKNIKLIGSSRLRTSLISNAFETAMGAPIINNSDNGIIKSLGFYYNFIKNNEKYNFKFNLTLLDEDYDININNYLLNIFGFPIGSTFRDNNLIGKEALILGFEVKQKLSKIDLGLSLSQHIPVKLKYRNEDSNEASNGNDKLYGGGLIEIFISYHL